MPTPEEIQAAERARIAKAIAEERDERRRDAGRTPQERAAREKRSLPEDAVGVGSDPLGLAPPQSQTAPGAVPAQAGLMPPDVRPGSDWLSVIAALPPLDDAQRVL